MFTLHARSGGRLRPRLAATALLIAAAAPLHAGSMVEAVVDVQQHAAAEARDSQQRIDRLADETQEILQEYRHVQRQLESLRAYNDNLEAMVGSQAREVDSYREQIDQIEVTNREIVPLMLRMLATLERFVELDMPFLPEERAQRLAGLDELMQRADVDTSEKYRRILEAYQVEADYGRNIEAYRGELTLEGETLTVEFLRVARLALLYQSLDGRRTGFWHPTERSWQSLDDSYRRPVEQALRIAHRQAAPELIRIPVVLTEETPR